MDAKIVLFVVLNLVAYSSAARCSFYGWKGETGSQTASGEPFNANALTCATMPHLPINSVLQVTNQRTGRSITVRVNDRIGGSVPEDTIDLTYGAFGTLSKYDDGVFPCTYTLL